MEKIVGGAMDPDLRLQAAKRSAALCFLAVRDHLDQLSRGLDRNPQLHQDEIPLGAARAQPSTVIARAGPIFLLGSAATFGAIPTAATRLGRFWRRPARRYRHGQHGSLPHGHHRQAEHDSIHTSVIVCRRVNVDHSVPRLLHMNDTFECGRIAGRLHAEGGIASCCPRRLQREPSDHAVK